MALNFPDSPTLNQIYTDTTSGFSYQWDGVVWQSYSAASSSQIRIIDDISGSFNGSTQTFALAVSGTAISPANAQQLRVVLGGVVQEPLTDYTISGSNITFTTPPGSGLDCSIVSLGPAVPLSTILDGTVTPSKLSTGGPSWNTDGDVYIAGITTIVNASGKVIAGIGTTALIVEGNARVTGILTVGTSSITLDGTNNRINVGTGLTLSSGGIQVGVITATTLNATSITGTVTGNATGLTGTPNIAVTNITGVAATFTGNVSIAGTLTYEDVTNVDSIGVVTARSGLRVTGSDISVSSGGISVSGVATASSFSGSGANLTSLNASNLGSGTVPDARFPATLPTASGANLTSLNANNISSGTLAIARGGTNSTSTPTAGGAAYGTGSAFAFTSAGTSGQVLTSNGTSAPTWTTPAGGGMILLNTFSFSGSSSVNITSTFDNTTYDNYAIVHGPLISSDGSVLHYELSKDNGSSWNPSGTQYYSGAAGQAFNSSWFPWDNSVSTSIGGSGIMFIYNLYGTTSRPLFSFSASTSGTTKHIGGYIQDSTNTYGYNAMRIRPNTGTISGVITVYGFKK